MKRILWFIILFPQFIMAVHPVRWEAQWIMHPEVAPQSHAVVLFRKTFEVTKAR